MCGSPCTASALWISRCYSSQQYSRIIANLGLNTLHMSYPIILFINDFHVKNTAFAYAAEHINRCAVATCLVANIFLAV